MINEAFDELPEWIQKSEELLTYIETLPYKKKKEALSKAARIIMSDKILSLTEKDISIEKIIELSNDTLASSG